MALYRAQILLEDRQHEELEKLARESGRSMSELVREIMAEYLDRTSEERGLRHSLAAIESLGEVRHEIEARNGLLHAALLEELREERTAELSP